MCREFAENERLLVGLACRMESFTEDELVRRYEERYVGRSLFLNRLETVHDLLERLVAVGSLHRVGGEYHSLA